MKKFDHSLIKYLKNKFHVNEENAKNMYEGLILIDKEKNHELMKKEGQIYINTRNLIKILKESQLIQNDQFDIENYIGVLPTFSQKPEKSMIIYV